MGNCRPTHNPETALGAALARCCICALAAVASAQGWALRSHPQQRGAAAPPRLHHGGALQGSREIVQRLSEKHAIDFVPSGALTLATDQVHQRRINAASTPHAARRHRRCAAALRTVKRCTGGGRSSWS